MSLIQGRALVTTACLTLMTSFAAIAQDPRANMPAALDPGHNAHQELVIFGCLVAISAMLATILLLLWFLVSRRKSEVRDIKRVLPQVVDIMRANALEDDEGDEQVVSGTMRAPEFEAGFMTSSSMADNTAERLHPRYRQHQVHVEHQIHAEQQPAVSLRSPSDISSSEGLTNHIASSSQSNQSQRTNQFDGRVHQQGRARRKYKDETHDSVDDEDVFGPSNHGPREELSANQLRTLLLGDFPHQSTGRNNTTQPELSARIEVSTISARETDSRSIPQYSHAYDNPDMSRAYTPTNHIEILTNDQDKLKYRNSYYESHV
ncbi:uncharacterized protein [Asterias amurensis]|uniref:uncharacterized protein n=1 Tax=Asterias amurensis TaxID=7602 RepID=UPI003AB4AD8B